MKYAICNELFEGWSFGDTCREIARFGYTVSRSPHSRSLPW